MKILKRFSKEFLFRLSEQEVKWVKDELKKNKFFFDKVFYTKLKEMLQRLNLSG